MRWFFHWWFCHVSSKGFVIYLGISFHKIRSPLIKPLCSCEHLQNVPGRPCCQMSDSRKFAVPHVHVTTAWSSSSWGARRAPDTPHPVPRPTPWVTFHTQSASPPLPPCVWQVVALRRGLGVRRDRPGRAWCYGRAAVPSGHRSGLLQRWAARRGPQASLQGAHKESFHGAVARSTWMNVMSKK